MTIMWVLQRGFKTLLITSTALLVSCSSLGPSTIERDRMDYGLSLNTSIKQQLLGNIVRLRYMEAPVFVDVASVINQYSLSGSVDAGLGFNSGSNTANLGAGGRWEDRPTITYSPISGKKFSESLLTPISPESLFALVQSGWPPELMFRLTVAQINGVAGANPPQQAAPGFRETLSVWTRLREARILALRRSNNHNERARIVLYVNDVELDDQTREDLSFLQETLGLRKGAKEFTLTYGLISSDPDSLVVLTLSILDMMVDLAQMVDVPQQHIDEGRTFPTFVDTGLGGPLLQVHSSIDKPEMAYVAIRDRGYWFYIDDRDLMSKRTFGVLQILLSLTDSGDTARGPLLSIGG
ncbi:hypothetical protein [Moritella sp. F3]|uniref:hypothetical protein n=1 Tax=Moritella sp. F3 TaxID=2718882 RepID=UPI0018E196EB|nr:hypothetical protein [Moritella sp. F3]